MQDVSLTPFFHPTPMARMFDAAVAANHALGLLTETQARWLLQAVTLSRAQGGAALYRFSFDDDPLSEPGLAAALLIVGPEQCEYLFTPLRGVDIFADRNAVLQCLRERGIRLAGMSIHLIEGDAFTGLMHGYVTSRAARLARTAALLGRQPSLIADPQRGGTLATLDTLEAVLQDYWQADEGGRSREVFAEGAYIEGLYQSLLEAQTVGNVLGDHYAALIGEFPYGDHLTFQTVHMALGNERYPLAGALVWYREGEPARCLYLPEQGISGYPDALSLRQALARPTPWQALPAVAHTLWDNPGVALEFLTVPSASAITLAVAQVLSLPGMNVHGRTAQWLHLPRGQATVELGRALDIRACIDRRLAALDPVGRWQTLEGLAPPPAFDPGQVPPGYRGMVERLLALRLWRETLALARPSPLAAATELLRPALSVFNSRLDPGHVQISEGDGQWVSLPQLLVERFTQLRSGPLPATRYVELTGHLPIPGLDAGVLEILLSQLVPAFEAYYLAQTTGRFLNGYRLGGEWVAARRTMADTLENILRVELALARQAKVVDPSLLNLLSDALSHSREVRVYALDVTHFTDSASIRIPGAFAVEAAAPSQLPVVLWSAALGVETFASLPRLCETVAAQLRTGRLADRRFRLFSTLDLGQFTFAQAHQVKVSAMPMEGEVTEYTSKIMQGWWAAQFEHVLGLAKRVHAQMWFVERCVGWAGEDPMAPAWARLAVEASQQQVTEVMPPWWGAAPWEAQRQLFYYLQEVTRAVKPGSDYLHGIPGLLAFAAERARLALAADGFAGLDPDQIMVTTRRYAPGGGWAAIGEVFLAPPVATGEDRRSLTQVLLMHRVYTEGAMFLAAADGSDLPSGITPAYVRALVQRLDCGEQYRAELARLLGPDDPEQALRERQFCAQFSPQLLAAAYCLHLAGALSTAAFAAVETVLQAPDARARAAAGLGEGSFERLSLQVAKEPVDELIGVFLFHGQGVVVLYVHAEPTRPLRQFPDLAALSQAVREEAPLRHQLLGRLPAHRQQHYDRVNFDAPHLDFQGLDPFAEPVTAHASLRANPVTGNALLAIYADNATWLKYLAQSQTVNNAEARWNDFLYVVTLAIEQGSMFLPQPLGALVGLWQGQTLASGALDAARLGHWGEAAAALVAAMSTVLSLQWHGAPVGGVQAYHANDFSWRYGALSIELGQRLVGFEARTKVLADLQLDQTLNLFSEDDRHYASVHGKVFQVRQVGGAWRLVSGEGESGPAIRRNDQGEWVFDALSLRGGGVGPSQCAATHADDTLEHALQSLAQPCIGLEAIRRRSAYQADTITRSLTKAQRYLTRALARLPASGLLDVEARSVLEATFGPRQATPNLVAQLRDKVIALSQETYLLSTRAGQQRWIAGTNVPEEVNRVAFVIGNDSQRRIFLTDLFFSYQHVPAMALSFDYVNHARSATLIHEISHQVLDTVDMTYLGLEWGYLDITGPKLSYDQLRLAHQARRHLVWDCPPAELFRSWGHDTWQDPDEAHPGRPLKRIYALSGQRSLAGARAAFAADAAVRRSIVLNNADSLTGLILDLGRDLPVGG